MKILTAAACLAVLSSFAGAAPLDWSQDAVAQSAVELPPLYAHPRVSDSFPFEKAKLKDGRATVNFTVRFTPWSDLIEAQLEACDSTSISDMDPNPHCAYMAFDFHQELIADRKLGNIKTPDGHVVATLTGDEIRWLAAAPEYRITDAGAVEVFLKRAP